MFIDAIATPFPILDRRAKCDTIPFKESPVRRRAIHCASYISVKR